MLAGTSSTKGHIESPDVLLDAGLEAVDIGALDLESGAINVVLTPSHTIQEGGTITYTATVYQGVSSDLEVLLDNGKKIFIQAGETQGSTTIETDPDDPYQDPETVRAKLVTLLGNDAANLSIPKPEVRTIVEPTIDPTTLTLSASELVYEGKEIIYTATLSRPVALGDTLTVHLSNGKVIEIQGGETEGTVTETSPTLDTLGTVMHEVSIEHVNNRFELLNIEQATLLTEIRERTELTEEDTATIMTISRLSESGGGSSDTGSDSADSDSDDTDSDDSETVESDSSATPGSSTLGSGFAGDSGTSSGDDSDGGDDEEDTGTNVEMDVYSEEVYL